ncbi:hypothetical protein D770_20670 [Flammeovirgaceae bacterium 311]|nr:hypothetical protein D770_20670 [Flammeovirgaceae bacterium 311]
MYWIGGLLILTLVIPNTTNFKERNAFSDSRRLEVAQELYRADQLGDSVTVVPGPYYDRGKFFTFFLGEKQRELWRTPVTVPVFSYEKTMGGLEPYEFGGGNQTISMRLEDDEDRKWALRTVNKDQIEALPKLLRPTFLRFMFRDQVAAMNPYGPLVVSVLAEAIDIHHTNPRMFLVPYNEQLGEFNERMAGRLAYLEEHLNSSWKKSERFGKPKDIVNTEEMMEMQQEKTIPLDTLLYLKSRLFDMLISDWDRHEGQWEWALIKQGDQEIFEPIPKDRDIAFYVFNEGILSRITLLFNNKFQSFREDYGKVSGLVKQSEDQDKRILAPVPQVAFTSAAREIQQKLTPAVIHEAFSKYPEDVYDKVGPRHEEILKVRLEKLPDTALRYYELLQK